jgi:NAD(P)-dependent dehydrogenase (short-subunit alcohol dehydrogenase family)
MLGRRLFQQERASHDADRCHHRGQRGHRPRNAGTIVQVGSALSERAIPLQSAYCGAKHAVNGFTGSLRCQLMYAGCNVHLAQALLTSAAHFAGPTSRVPHICGAGVDRMHASTMVGWRRLIARSGRWHWLMRGFETTLGVAGIVAAGGPDGSDGCGSTG